MNEGMIAEKIFEILDESGGYSELNDWQKKEMLKGIEKKWSQLPPTKFQCSESAMLALMMIDEYIYFKEFEMASRWADVIIDDENRPDFGEKEFLKGKILFGDNKFESALSNFKIAFKKSKGREFEGEDPKYLDFLQNPEKYMTK